MITWYRGGMTTFGGGVGAGQIKKERVQRSIVIREGRRDSCSKRLEKGGEKIPEKERWRKPPGMW